MQFLLLHLISDRNSYSSSSFLFYLDDLISFPNISYTHQCLPCLVSPPCLNNPNVIWRLKSSISLPPYFFASPFPCKDHLSIFEKSLRLATILSSNLLPSNLYIFSTHDFLRFQNLPFEFNLKYLPSDL